MLLIAPETPASQYWPHKKVALHINRDGKADTALSENRTGIFLVAFFSSITYSSRYLFPLGTQRNRWAWCLLYSREYDHWNANTNLPSAAQGDARPNAWNR
jgi:hypothetical protein